MIEWNKFKTTKEDYELIGKIVDRIMRGGTFPQGKRTDYLMDIECAFNDVDINLQKLLDFTDADFVHDTLGIYSNLNRQTAKLENSFVPRSIN